MRQSQLIFNLLTSLIGRRYCGGDATTLLRSSRFGGSVFPSSKVLLNLNHCSSKDICSKRYKMSEAASQQSSSTTAAGSNDSDRSKCIFCKIIDGKEENEIYYQVRSHVISLMRH